MQFSSEFSAVSADMKNLPADAPIRCQRYIQKYRPMSGLHYHNCLELGRCVAGSGIMMIGGRTYSFGAGSVSVIPCGAVHDSHITMQPGDEGSVWEFIFADPAAMGIRSREWGGFISDERELSELFAMFFGEVSARPAHCEERIPHLLAAFLLGAQRLAPAAADGQSAELPQEMAYILRRISCAYDQPLRVEDLAQECLMSVSSFGRMFRRTMHTTPLLFIENMRLSVARHLLLSTNKSVLEISAEAGFRTLSSFNRLFKSRFGCSPREMRAGRHS